MHLTWQGRSSHQTCSIKVGFLKNFAIFTGNHQCWSLLLIKLQVFRPATLLIQVFSYKYCEILKTPILKIICVRLLLTTEAVVQRCSWEKVFWKYAANLLENIHAEVWLQKLYLNYTSVWVFSCNFAACFQNTFS